MRAIESRQAAKGCMMSEEQQFFDWLARLFPSFAGGLIGLLVFVRPRNRLEAVGAIVAGTVAAHYLTPLWGYLNPAWGSDPSFGFLTGALVMTVVPAAVRRVRDLIATATPNVPGVTFDREDDQEK